MWAEGLAMFKSNPITGVGYGQFFENTALVAHNSFVHTLAELGFAGAFCLVGMFYWYFTGLRRGSSGAIQLDRWREALMASGAGVLGCAWFLSRQYVVVPYILLGVGTAASTLSVPDPAILKTKAGDVRNILALTIGLIMIVYISVRTLAIWSGG